MSIKTQITVAATTLAALALLAPMSASAQRNGGGNGGVPGGSYAQSCSNASVQGGRLYAECRGIGRNSRPTSSSIEFGRCTGDIANSEGMLVCNGAQGRPESGNGGGGNNGGGNNGGNGGRPAGSYAQTCSNVRVEGGRLYAECRDMSRQTRASSIEYGRCTGGINNIDGLLTCDGTRGRFEGRGGNNGGGWGGGNGNGGGNNGGGWGGNNGGRNSITVYEDSNYRGGSTTFNREMPNLGRRELNDNISSMEMNGSWEACSDAYFRGNCQTFTGSVRNLNSTVLNDRISSLRPVRGW
ncbi:MAG TPA: beta/gamma crystallin-related protein [Brevundimonas sp.]|jgi:hypothetical protein